MDGARGKRRSEMGAMGGQRIYANKRVRGRQMERRGIELTQGKEGEKEGGRREKGKEK